MNSKELVSIIDSYGASEETMLSLRDIFMQGDIRYSDPEHEAIVAGFIDNSAVSVIKSHIAPEAAPLGGINGPQKEIKAIARVLLKRNGYRIKSIERAFGGNIPDILANGKETIAVECGPCNFRKAIDYLEAGAALWILKPSFSGHDLYEIRRGSNWEGMISIHKKRNTEAAKLAVDAAFKSA